jgi:hypothetical protein
MVSKNESLCITSKNSSFDKSNNRMNKKDHIEMNEHYTSKMLHDTLVFLNELLTYILFFKV